MAQDRVKRLKRLSTGIGSFSEYQGVFTVLAEAGILSDKSLEFLVPMSGIRNVLVHGYDKVEDNVICGVLKRHLDNFVSFLKEIKKNYLDRKNRTDSSGESRQKTIQAENKSS